MSAAIKPGGRPAWQIVVGFGVLMGLVLLGLHGVNKVFLGDGDFLALDDEASIGTWYSASNFFVAGALGLLGAIVDKPRRRWWLLAGLFFMACFVDDVAGVHEASEDASDKTTRLVLEPLATLAGCTVLVLLGRSLRPPARLLAFASAGLLALGVLASLVDAFDTPPHVIYVLLMYIEEESEMLMATALIAASFAAGIPAKLYSPSTFTTRRLSRPPSNSV